jgi:hypothetical protein
MKLDRSHHLLRALEGLGRDPARLEEDLTRVMAQTGATAAELREALSHGDRFGADQRQALEALLDRRLAHTVAPAKQGVRPHQVRARKHKPWYGAVSDAPTLGPVLFPEPPRDIEVGGARLGREELLQLLRGAS